MKKIGDINYTLELNKLLESNSMYHYEDIYSDFLAVQYSRLSGGELKIILRCDIVCAELAFHIRYLKSMDVMPKYILSTQKEQRERNSIYGIDIICVDELRKLCTSQMILLIVNRESDFGINTQEDYREDSFDFIMRERAQMGFVRERGIENLYYFSNHFAEYNKVLNMLEDDASKCCFIECIRALVENDIYRKNQGESNKKYFDDDIYIPLKEEIWINCGAATGDTILRFINDKKECKEIYAVEVDRRMLSQLELLKRIISTYTDYSLKLVDRYLEKGENSIDKLFENKKVTLINMDVEGAEMNILESAEETIKKGKAVLAIAAYHKPEHLINIPIYIKHLNKDYHLYIRKYRGYAPEAINEYVYYAVPTERIAKH